MTEDAQDSVDCDSSLSSQ